MDSYGFLAKIQENDNIAIPLANYERNPSLLVKV